MHLLTISRQSERLIEKERVINEVTTRFIRLREADFTVRLRKEAIKQAEKELKIVEFDYRRGRARNSEVVRAQNKLLDIKNRYEVALVQFKIARLSLDHYAGKLTIDEKGEWLR